MKIVVCIRQGLDGEISPFDACAYEEALKIPEAEITLVSMGPASVQSFLSKLTRLGAKDTVLLCDKAFAGADTLATAVTLSKALEKLSADFVFCGRQTLIGDTGQTPPMIAEFLNFRLIPNVMKIVPTCEDTLLCTTRTGETFSGQRGTLITVEKINTLRLPRLRSKEATVTLWDAQTLGLTPDGCGLKGSPTRVLRSFENQSGKRKCQFITKEELPEVIKAALKNTAKTIAAKETPEKANLPNVMVVGQAPMTLAKTVSNDITCVELSDADTLTALIEKEKPTAVIWGSDVKSKELAARVAARLHLGLCADCTQLENENGELMMYRPALSGSVIAKIKSLTKPSMCTVRTEESCCEDIIVALGYGVKDAIPRAKAFAQSIGGTLASSRKLVDNDYLPYELQVGLTGRTVSPPVYIALGISGAVHHIAGMQNSGTVIAVNPDKDAPIFEYADYGIIDEF